jgi:uncharacterized protein with ParB-like and HNH nuclease domain
MNVPIPPVYTAELQDGKEIIIDGQQRLTTMFSFIEGKFLDDANPFKLSGLTVMKELNSKTFKELDMTTKRAFQNYEQPMIVISKHSNSEVKFQIFERLNTGSVKLNDQELRNCIYRGKYNDFIKELANNKDFQYVLDSPRLHERMLDSELVLRFFSFYHNTYLKYVPPVKRMMNKDMERYQNLEQEEEKELRNAFATSVELTKSVFANKAFKRFVRGSKKDPNGLWESKKVNRGLFDIIMFGFTQFNQKNRIVPIADSIREEFMFLMTHNDEFIESISGSSTDLKEKIHTKFKVWLSALENLVGSKHIQDRNFSTDFKKQLYDSKNICSICNQIILTLDDAEIDHIQHYWRGGETIPSNARLTHRYCNRSRGPR